MLYKQLFEEHYEANIITARFPNITETSFLDDYSLSFLQYVE